MRGDGKGGGSGRRPGGGDVVGFFLIAYMAVEVFALLKLVLAFPC